MTDELKPVRCGCGGEAKVISYLSREYCKMAYYVRCVECGTETDDLHSEAEAVQAWNRAIGATDIHVGDKFAKDINVPRKGKWQRRKGSDCWECSECHAVLESDDIVRHNYYYCYHCGADMMNEDGYMKLEGIENE
jgi:hypothetical protein